MLAGPANPASTAPRSHRGPASNSFGSPTREELDEHAMALNAPMKTSRVMSIPSPVRTTIGDCDNKWLPRRTSLACRTRTPSPTIHPCRGSHCDTSIHPPDLRATARLGPGRSLRLSLRESDSTRRRLRHARVRAHPAVFGRLDKDRFDSDPFPGLPTGCSVHLPLPDSRPLRLNTRIRSKVRVHWLRTRPARQSKPKGGAQCEIST
jgi:hypothetical protein